MHAFKSDDSAADAVSAESDSAYHIDALNALDFSPARTNAELPQDGSPRPFEADMRRERPILWLGVDTPFRIGHD